MDTLQAVRRTIQRYNLITPGETIVVGVSGGPDSLCLLHLLQRLVPALRLTLHVGHLHHGLRGDEADADAAFVRETAAAWGLNCTVGLADVPALAQQPGLSIEEAARQARYAFLAQVAGEVDARTIAVGHNADDQTETVLMHWLRGSGLAGLRGMAPRTRLAHYRLPIPHSAFSIQHSTFKLIRPLLFTPRAAVLRYCQEQGLQPRFDRSNEDATFFRNRLRHELLPLLESYNPQIGRILRRTAAVIADDYDLLRQNLHEIWPEVALAETHDRLLFDLARWRSLPASLQRGVLRRAIGQLRRSLRNIDWIHTENALWALREGQTGARMTLPGGLELVLGYSRFAVGDQGVELPSDDAPQLTQDRQPLALPGVTPLGDPADWRVAAALLAPAELPAGWRENADPWQAWLDADVVGPRPALRVRQAGDRFQPLGMAGRRKLLGEFLTNAKTPAAARVRWPLLITSREEIAWVCGLRIDERAKVTAATRQALHLRLHRPQRG